MENTSVEKINQEPKLSEQEIFRRESLIKLKELGIEPYPAEKFDVNCLSDEILGNYSEEKKIIRKCHWQVG